MGVNLWKSDLIDAFDTTGDWAGDAVPSTVPAAIPLNAGGRLETAASPSGFINATSPELITLVSFTGYDGADPGPLIFDAAGDLLGSTTFGGIGREGTVFEIAKSNGGYADAPTPISSFGDVTNEGVQPGGLSIDAAGDLFGVTSQINGYLEYGSVSVFEIAKTRSGYAAATPLVQFTGADGAGPEGPLITDAAGDLFGTTYGYDSGPDIAGTVFEIAKTKNGYASAPTTLASFSGADGENPNAGLVADAAGDLFGTTFQGGPNGYRGGNDGDGTVFEIVKTQGGYASAPTTLVGFEGGDGANPAGAYPFGGLIADAAGDLFGVTKGGGAYGYTNDNEGYGTVFEIAKTKNGYASAPTTLASFAGADGWSPSGSLIADAAGDLFGTTMLGGADGDGTVFEIVKTQSGYASAPITLVSFTGADGLYPQGSLIADAMGDLFGATGSFGAENDGTVFEITDSGFVTQQPKATLATAGAAQAPPPVAAFVQAMAGHGPSLSAEPAPTFLASRNETSALLSRPHAAY